MPRKGIKQPLGFDSALKERVVMSQDVFLVNNRYLLDEEVDLPRGGACAGHDTVMWFSMSGSQGATKEELDLKEMAIEICRGCPIRQKCLMYSLEYEPFGVWGGFAESQRTMLRVFWNIEPKRTWVSRGSLFKNRNVSDYISYPEDIDFVKKVAHDQNLAQPFAPKRPGLPSASGRRIRPRVAQRTR
jgi:WhiB family redox-sensing transcriptional regulator